MLSITVDTKPVQDMLSRLSKQELPTALRNTLNDTARDVAKRLGEETRKVFDRPTPLVQRGFRVEKMATKTDLRAEVWIKDVYGRGGSALINTLTPHIPRFPNVRQPKGMERQLRARGLLSGGQWLVPSRTMRLDQHGNISGGQAQKMLADIGAYTAAGAPGRTKASKVRYVWGTVKSRKGGTVTGIWDQSRFLRGQNASEALLMVAVDKRPTYRKRFDFFRLAQEHALKVMPRHAQLAIEHAIARSRR